jgi:hypothetical protein
MRHVFSLEGVSDKAGGADQRLRLVQVLTAVDANPMQRPKQLHCALAQAECDTLTVLGNDWQAEHHTKLQQVARPGELRHGQRPAPHGKGSDLRAVCRQWGRKVGC